MQTPVVLIIFNRPQTTQSIFDAIRQAKPKQLLIVADGSRSDRPGEAEKCAEARKITEAVDWDCEVFRNYSDINLGCALRPSSGISWAFEQFDKAIILEDDCLPHPCFFEYCETLLNRYEHEPRIMHISGNNYLPFAKTKYSYYFSRYPLCWGWATWRRAWQHYDFKMEKLALILQEGWLDKFFADSRAARYWAQTLSHFSQTSWDYQWMLTCWLQGGSAILPSSNLVSNIGFDTDSTHTSDPAHAYARFPTQSLSFPLTDPPFIIHDSEVDRYIQNTLFDPSQRVRTIRKLNKALSKFNFLLSK